MILKIGAHEQITDHRPGDRYFKAREVIEISREEFEIRQRHQGPDGPPGCQEPVLDFDFGAPMEDPIPEGHLWAASLS